MRYYLLDYVSTINPAKTTRGLAQFDRKMPNSVELSRYFYLVKRASDCMRTWIVYLCWYMHNSILYFSVSTPHYNSQFLSKADGLPIIHSRTGELLLLSPVFDLSLSVVCGPP